MIVTFNKQGATMEQGMAAHQQGRLAEAEGIYRQILAQNPAHPDATHMLGLLAFQSGNVTAAIELTERALALTPQNASIHSNLGEMKRVTGRLDEAAALCRRAIALQPNMGAAYVNLSMVLHQQGNPAEALPVARRAVELSPREAPAYTALGAALTDLQRHDEAIPYLETSLRLNPKDAGVASSLGICYTRLEMYDKAKAALDRSVEMAPDHPQVLMNMAAFHAQIEHFADAVPWLERILRKDPDYLPALEYLAGIRTGLKDFQGSIDLCRRILEKNPQAMDIYATMGEALMNLGRFDETIELMHQALAIKPWPTVYQSLSNALVRTGRPQEALEALDKGLAMEPQNPVLHFNRAIILLLMGRLAEAWPEYEWRWKHPRMVGRTRRFAVPQWEGQPLNGKRVLFHAEQGMGDTIFFGRYATRVARERGGVPVMWVQTSMVEVVKTIPGVGEVIGETGPVPAHDYHLPIMSLPRVFNTTLETIPHDVPYIRPDPVRRDHWRRELSARTGKFKVGLVWEGGHFQPENFLRSNSLAAYAPLAQVPGVAFFGLQKGPAEEQCKNPPAGMDFTNLGPFIKDFTDTTAIIDNLDLLISIDTSVIHIAGALARPVWMLLAWSPGHMWMLDREDTPWYPTVRIFRQPAFQDWATPVARVKAELEKLMRERSRPQ